ncbi:MAG TPA: DMT family transporter [Gaiellaceae bacterium]
MIAAALALAASVVWGFGDFVGGVKARALPALEVMAYSQPFGLVLLVIAVAARGEGPPGAAVLWACLAALLGTIGLAAFYRGLATGAMSVVAPIAGAAAVIPIAIGLASGEHPGALAELGFVLAIGGVALTSRERVADRTKLARGAAWGLVALVAFGGFYVPMRTASQADVLWATLVFRITSVALVWTCMLLLRRRAGVGSQHLVALAAVGILDTAGNVLFAAAAAEGLVSVVSVLASLYPVVTALLARMALRERITRSQEVGVVVTIAGAALVATG